MLSVDTKYWSKLINHETDYHSALLSKTKKFQLSRRPRTFAPAGGGKGERRRKRGEKEKEKKRRKTRKLVAI
jgi:hypothetical protein